MQIQRGPKGGRGMARGGPEILASPLGKKFNPPMLSEFSIRFKTVFSDEIPNLGIPTNRDLHIIMWTPSSDPVLKVESY